jgi:hypothetical protein
MGIGGLGLMGRRRREALPGLRGEDGVEPLAATLRNSARTEAADHRRAPLRLDGFRRLIDAFRDSLLNATRPTRSRRAGRVRAAPTAEPERCGPPPPNADRPHPTRPSASAV